jgi:hypothetical protein
VDMAQQLLDGLAQRQCLKTGPRADSSDIGQRQGPGTASRPPDESGQMIAVRCPTFTPK